MVLNQHAPGVMSLADLLLPSTEVDWVSAACHGDPNPEAWFPFPSQNYDYARSVCRDCPIRDGCRQVAIDTGQSGVWGGIDFDRGRVVEHP